jgi:hypothetical protein
VHAACAAIIQVSHLQLRTLRRCERPEAERQMVSHDDVYPTLQFRADLQTSDGLEQVTVPVEELR